MNYELREREARWSDLALLCHVSGPPGSWEPALPRLRGGQVEPPARALLDHIPCQIFRGSDLQVLSSTTSLEASLVVSEVRE